MIVDDVQPQRKHGISVELLENSSVNALPSAARESAVVSLIHVLYNS
jgi:hypothetical protein